MAISTTDVEGEALENRVEKPRIVRKWSIVGVIFLVLLLTLGGVCASHYQPIVFAGGIGMDHRNVANQGTATQEFSLRNTGPIGVTVVGIKSGHNYGLSSQARFFMAKLCPPETPQGGDCRQNKKTGLLEGMTFHPFSLTTDNSRGVLLRYEYACAPSSGLGTALGTLTLPVTYRFLWFTHTILLTESADAATCSPK